MKTPGAAIKSARLRKGLTQDQLAQATGTTKAAISRYESDKRTPNAKIGQRIATALNISLFELYFGKTEDEFQRQLAIEQEAYEQELQDYYLPGSAKDLVAAFCRLNAEGQKKALERVEELTDIKKYLAEDSK